MEKATYTGHVAHKKKQVILQGNSFGKGYVHWTRSTQKKQVILQGNSFGKGYVHWTRSPQKKTSYFTWKFIWKRLRTLDSYIMINFASV